MSIKQHPSLEALTPPPVLPWGKVEPEGKTSDVVRFVLADRTVSLPASEFKRWELVAGDPERLTITTEKDTMALEGKALAEIRDALDKSRLVEVRVNGNRPTSRPGPVVRAITIEPA
ncbi:MAG: hypothetical protein ABIQ12_03760 [Opitutaceae bacterium]